MAARSPWMATANAPQRQPQSMDNAMGFQRVNGIGGACRCKPAMPRHDRGKNITVHSDNTDEGVGQGLCRVLQHCIHRNLPFHPVSNSAPEDGYANRLCFTMFVKPLESGF